MLQAALLILDSITQKLLLLLLLLLLLTEHEASKKLNGPWRIKTNEELDDLIQRKNIIRFIKSQRLKWLGNVERMPKEREVTRIYKWKRFASRPIGRPKIGWEDDVRKDLQTMKIKNWKKSVMNRDLWKTVVTKIHIEL
jgi:hypothetical protein